MRARNVDDTSPVDSLVSTLDDALALLTAFAQRGEKIGDSLQNPGSLLEQCVALCAQHKAAVPEPVRLVHHFACTGGTLLSKCIAAMPNVQLLSEVDPLSTFLDQPHRPRFASSDMVTLMRQSTRGAKPELIIELFLNSLAVIHADAVSMGQRLVIRDHAHSHFCLGETIPDRPTLREIVSTKFPIASIVTVRHPLDSFLSLEANGWINFSPFTFDEYCKRYLRFLQAHEGIPLITYEGFTESPHAVMQEICLSLRIPYADQFADLFNVFKLTGESGRGGDFIERRPRRAVNERLAEEVDQSRHYQLLHEMLPYED